MESGSVAAKDEVNIMVKNVVDVVFGGLAYWAFGYGLSFGNGIYSNAFTGWGKFFYNPQRYRFYCLNNLLVLKFFHNRFKLQINRKFLCSNKF